MDRFHTYMSKKLSVVLRFLKIKVLTIREDQHSRGIHFGSIGDLLQKKEKSMRRSHVKASEETTSCPLLEKDANLLSKADLSSPDQHDLAVHRDTTFLQLVKVTLLPVLRIQDGTLDQNTHTKKKCIFWLLAIFSFKEMMTESSFFITVTLWLGL